MNNASHSLKAKVPAGIGLLVITLLVVGVIVLADRITPAVAETTTPTSQAPTAPDTAYKNGTYVETGSYNSPAGRESISVSLTLSGGTVTDSTVTRQANDQTASSYQGLFISGYKSMVNGKKIADIKLSNVAGSSLTPKGFMDALTKIKTDAGA